MVEGVQQGRVLVGPFFIPYPLSILISPLVPCLGIWLAVTLVAYCSPRG